ncbi:MAG: cation transporter [Bacteroidales bacterium]|jgi:cation diffusion facilitator family transporter|nr:cation transporter [Bacteroidales bacterium]MBQ1718027.1 cation transporter [Bacteroidales bacterium]MBQ4201795.1 cation transporter [Bacteroidales bacterium]
MTREKEISKVTLVGGAGNLLLLAFKFTAGILAHSAAMIADAVHSLSDFITDIVVLVFVGISARPQDSTHDYGHGKFETLATFFIGLALAAAAIGIVVNGAVKFASWLNGEELAAPGTLALWAALISIVVKEILYRYTASKGRKLESPAVVANAWHHRSDALSSIAAAVGIGGAILLGKRWTVLDPLASIVVGAMLLKVAWELVKPSLGELTEKSLPEETEKEILDIICSDPAVSHPHNLRTRRIGNRIAIEVHVRMDGDMPLREAHNKASLIERKLRDRFGPQTHVTVHTEPLKD